MSHRGPSPVVQAMRALRQQQAHQAAAVVSAIRAARSVATTAKSGEPVPGKSKLNFVAPVKLKARVAANGNRNFFGIAYTGGIMFPTITLPDGRVERGAVVMDLDTLTLSSQQVPVLDDHDESPDGTIGRTLSLRVQRPTYQMPVTGVIYGAKARAQKYLEAAAGGHKWQLSVGTDSFRLQRIPKGKSIRVNGRTFHGPVSIARGAYLTDLSFVAIGADDQTEAVIEARRSKTVRKGIR